MSVVLHTANLRQEMARRGLAAADLAKESQLSQATISAALSGRPIATKSLTLIAKTLSRLPIITVIDSLILTEDSAHSVE